MSAKWFEQATQSRYTPKRSSESSHFWQIHASKRNLEACENLHGPLWPVKLRFAKRSARKKYCPRREVSEEMRYSSYSCLQSAHDSRSYFAPDTIFTCILESSFVINSIQVEVLVTLTFHF